MSEARMAHVKIVKTKHDPALEKKMLANIENSRKDLQWIFANEEKLRSRYSNKFIAVKGKKVLFAHEDFKKLFAAIKAEGEDVDDFTIEYIREKPACLLL